MPCTAIITDGNELDQVIEHVGNYKAIVTREVRDLRGMGCSVKTKVFQDETLAYEWSDIQKGVL